MGKDLVKGNVEYCYVGQKTTYVTPNEKKLSCTILFELKDSDKNVVDTVNETIEKFYNSFPSIYDIIEFEKNEVFAFINERKNNYSGYIKQEESDGRTETATGGTEQDVGSGTSESTGPGLPAASSDSE